MEMGEENGAAASEGGTPAAGSAFFGADDVSAGDAAEPVPMEQVDGKRLEYSQSVSR
jgi:hypothetical protein